MKSSRQRFKEFIARVKQGHLHGDRLVDPKAGSGEYQRPMGGGYHMRGGGYGPPHKFKFSKQHLIGEYALMLRGYYWAVVILLLVVLGASLITLTPAFALKLAIDDVFAGKPLSIAKWLPTGALRHWITASPENGLTTLVTGLIIAEVLGVSLSWLRVLAVQRLNYKLAATLRQRLHTHLSKLSLAQLSDFRTGGIISRIMSDTDQIVGGIQNSIITPAGAALRVMFILIILIMTSWQLFAVAAVLIPPLILVHLVIFRRLRPLWRNIQDDRSMLSARVSDMYAGIRVVRGFRRENTELAEFGARQHTMVRKQYYTSILGRLLATGWAVFVPAIGIVILWYGGMMVLHHQMKVGNLVMFQLFAVMLLGPITQMIDSMQAMQQNLGSLDRVCDVLSQPVDMPDKPDARGLGPTEGRIEICHIGFGYRDDQTVLDGIDLTIPAGSTLAIVGPSGSGKTTLVNLIARFYDVRSGSIKLDGIDIRDIRLADFRRTIAMVMQDVFLFDGTVEENIGFGRRGATHDDIVRAAKLANADEFIAAMEQGYKTQIGERGNKLSGGQKQRISIARAILADPPILILDEATSSLDAVSERKIQESLQQLMHNRTTIIIAHRLSTIMRADAIAVLVDGRLAEYGNHATLIQHGGMYQAMFSQQALAGAGHDGVLTDEIWRSVGQP